MLLKQLTPLQRAEKERGGDFSFVVKIGYGGWVDEEDEVVKGYLYGGKSGSLRNNGKIK